MKVLVHLHTILQRNTSDGPQDRVELVLPSGSTIQDVIHHLEISLEGDAILLVVNGRHADPTRKLVEGDEIHLIPAISGGNEACA